MGVVDHLAELPVVVVVVACPFASALRDLQAPLLARIHSCGGGGGLVRERGQREECSEKPAEVLGIVQPRKTPYMAAALLQDRGEAAVVSLLKGAVAFEHRGVAGTCLEALMHCNTASQAINAWHAGSTGAIVSAMQTWPDDQVIQAVALGAIVHATGMGACGDAAELIATALGCMERHRDRLLLCQSGLRVIHYASLTIDTLPEPVRVATILSAAMTKYRRDDTVQYYGAHLWIALLSVDPADLARQCGKTGVEEINEKAVAVAAGATYSCVSIDAAPWHSFVLQGLFPRLRSAA